MLKGMAVNIEEAVNKSGLIATHTHMASKKKKLGSSSPYIPV